MKVLPAELVRKLCESYLVDRPDRVAILLSSCRRLRAITGCALHLTAMNGFGRTSMDAWDSFRTSRHELQVHLQLGHTGSKGDSNLRGLLPASPFLRSLGLVHSLELVSMASLAAGSLRHLSVGFCDNLRDLSPLTGCRELHSLHLVRCRGIEDVTPLASCVALRNLNLSYCRCTPPTTSIVCPAPPVCVYTIHVRQWAPKPDPTPCWAWRTGSSRTLRRWAWRRACGSWTSPSVTAYQASKVQQPIASSCRIPNRGLRPRFLTPRADVEDSGAPPASTRSWLRAAHSCARLCTPHAPPVRPQPFCL